MEDLDIKEDFKAFFQEGLAHDIFMSQGHYFIYRTIGENAHELNAKEESDEKKQLIYLQQVSMKMTIISLSRIFDNKNKWYKVRCINVLIDKIEDLPISYPVNLELYADLKKLASLTNVNMIKEVTNGKQLRSFYGYIYNSESVQSSVKKLRTVRSKFVAHNEHIPDVIELETFWDDISFLQDIAKLYMSTIGEICLDTCYALLQEIGQNKIDLNILVEFGWILGLLENAFGENNVKMWWD